MASTKKPVYKVETKTVVERKRRKSDLVIMWQSFWDVTGSVGLELWLIVLRIWEMIKLWFRSSERLQVQIWLERYLIYAPDDFAESWRDGRLLCILLNKLQPGCLPDANKLDPDYGLRNVYRAFDALEAHFGITPNVLAEEIVTCADGSDEKLFKILFRLKEITTYEAGTGEATVREAKEEPLQKPQTEKSCIAKGTGLAVAFVGKMSNFIIFCSSVADLDIVVEIKGPSNTICCERITKRSPRRRLSASLWDSTRMYPITRSLSYNENINSSYKFGTLVDDPEKEEKITIPLEYEILGNQVNVGYKPIYKGQHTITILWRGFQVSDSPYIINVEDATEMSGTNHNTHLRSALKSANCEEKHGQKNISVRFKDNNNATENEHMGKVLSKKVLRYIVKVGNQDVAVEADSTESLATELLKMDYEYDKSPTFYRRNSWGFAGEAERKRSVIRQFHVDVSELEAQSLQRRSHSLSINSKKGLRRTGSIEDLASQTRLRTVAEGTAKDFNKHEFMDSENEDSFAYITESVDSITEDVNIEELNLDQNEDTIKNDGNIYTTLDEPFKSKSEIKVDDEPKKEIVLKDNNIHVCKSDVNSAISSLSATPNKAKEAEILSEDRKKNQSENQLMHKSKFDDISNLKENKESQYLINTNFGEKEIAKTEKMKKKDMANNGFRCHHCIAAENNVHKFCKMMKSKSERKVVLTSKRKIKKRKSKKIDIQVQPLTSNYVTRSDEASISSSYSVHSGECKFKKKKFKSKFKKCSGAKKVSKINNKSFLRLCKLGKQLRLHDELKNNALKKSKVKDEYSGFKVNKIKESINEININSRSKNSVGKSQGTCKVSLLNNSRAIVSSKDTYLVPNSKSYSYWPPNYINISCSEHPKSREKETDFANEQLSPEKESSNPLGNSNIANSAKNITTALDANLLQTLTIPNCTSVNPTKCLSLKTHILQPIAQYNFRQFNPPSEKYSSINSVKHRILQWEKNLSSAKQNEPSKKSFTFHTENQVRSKMIFWETAFKSEEKPDFQDTKSFPAEQGMNITLNCQDNFHKAKLAVATSDTESTGIKSFLEDLSVVAPKRKYNTINQTEKILSKKQTNDKLSVELSKSPVTQRRSFSDPGVLETSKENYEKCFDHPAATRSSVEDNMDSFYDVNFFDSSTSDDLSVDSLQASTEDEYIDDEIPESASDFWGDITLLKGLKNSSIIEYKNEAFHSDSDIFASTFQNAKSYPSECKVFGLAVYYGYVAVKNKFQVLTKGAGCGNLSVSVQGFGRHDVSFVNVAYAQKDIYVVTYQVMRPGHYLISVRWMDSPVPGSPFVCKVAY